MYKTDKEEYWKYLSTILNIVMPNRFYNKFAAFKFKPHSENSNPIIYQYPIAHSADLSGAIRNCRGPCHRLSQHAGRAC